MKKNILLIVLISLFYISCQSIPKQVSQNNPLLGAWDLKEIHWVRADTTYKITPSQKGMLLFTPKHYSIMWIPTNSARKPFQILAKPTDEEAIAGFKSVVFNAGTYQFGENFLNTEAQIAKVPGFEGGKQMFDLQLNGNKLILTMKDETYPNGSKPDWVGKMSTRLFWERSE